MSGSLKIVACVVLALVLCPVVANATIAPVDQWLLGDSDSPAAVINGAGDDPTVPSLNGFNLAKTSDANGPTYVAGGAPGSSFAMHFSNTPATGGGSAATEYYRTNTTGNLITSGTNWGVDLWLKFDSSGSSAAYQQFLQIGENGNWWEWRLDGSRQELAMLGSGLNATKYTTYTPAYGTWFHFCYVTTSNTTASMYVNGTDILDLTSSDVSNLYRNVPNDITVSGEYYSGANHIGFVGAVDDIRVFTFSGTFNPNDVFVPEPGTLALLAAGLAGLLAYAWRKRR